MVHDFRIYDGWEAYFCGTSGEMAVVGMFRIPSVFFLGGGIRMWTIPLPVYYPNYQYISGLVWLRDLTRLSLYEVGGQVCMAMVGEAIFDPVSQIPKTVVVSSYFDGAQWNLYVDASKPYNFIRFTDIECLDDVIVAVGTDVNNSGCYMKTYKKMLDFPGKPCTAGAGFRIPFKNPVGKALVAKYLGNEAAIAHYDASGSTVMHRVAFDATGAIPTMTAATWQSSPSSVYGYSADWKMFEMATATNTTPNRHTWLLQKTDYPMAGNPVPQPWLVRFDNVMASGSIQSARVDYGTCSLDIDKQGLYPRCSGRNPRLTVYSPITNLMEWRCLSPYHLSLEYSSVLVERVLMYDGSYHAYGPGNYLSVVVFEVAGEVICE
jgi:hypothetical protein